MCSNRLLYLQLVHVTEDFPLVVVLMVMDSASV